jgi:hypothetical protein
MGCVYEKHLTLTRTCRLQQRFQLGCQKSALGGGMFLDRLVRRQRDGCQTTPFQTKHFFKKARTWVGLRSMPVSYPSGQARFMIGQGGDRYSSFSA